MAEVKFLLSIQLLTLFLALYVKSEEDANEKWKKKDIRDYTDADLERLYEQWEVGNRNIYMFGGGRVFVR